MKRKAMTYTAEFETFWKAYPTRWNKDLGLSVKRKKYPAFVKWQTLNQEIRDDCLAKVKLIKRTEGAAVRDCVTWLNQYGWDDIELPRAKPEPLPANVVPIMKGVPQGDRRSTSDKVNKQRQDLARKAK